MEAHVHARNCQCKSMKKLYLLCLYFTECRIQCNGLLHVFFLEYFFFIFSCSSMLGRIPGRLSCKRGVSSKGDVWVPVGNNHRWSEATGETERGKPAGERHDGTHETTRQGAGGRDNHVKYMQEGELGVFLHAIGIIIVLLAVAYHFIGGTEGVGSEEAKAK